MSDFATSRSCATLCGRLARRLAVALVAVLGASVCLPTTPALALATHVFSDSFGSAGSLSGQFSSPADTAVDVASHDVYVADSGNFRVQKFDSAGNFILMFGKGVDRTTGGDVCTAASGDVCQAGTPGLGGGAQFSSPSFVAVDDSGGQSRGDVYVADAGNNVVSKFDASGLFISSNDGKSATNGPFGSLAGLAVDTSGNVWVYGASSEMFEFDEGGGFLQNWESGFGVSPAGIAVDSHDNTFIVRGNPLVEKLTSSGGDIGSVTAEADNRASGLAVDPATNDLYVEQEGSAIEQFASCDPSGGPCSATDSFGAEHLSGRVERRLLDRQRVRGGQGRSAGRRVHRGPDRCAYRQTVGAQPDREHRDVAGRHQPAGCRHHLPISVRPHVVLWHERSGAERRPGSRQYGPARFHSSNWPAAEHDLPLPGRCEQCARDELRPGSDVHDRPWKLPE